MDLTIALPDQLSQHLRSLRKARGLSQAELAARMGVVQSRVSAIEKNAASMSIEQLHKVLSALDASMVIRFPASDAAAHDPLLGAELKNSPKDMGQW